VHKPYRGIRGDLPSIVRTMLRAEYLSVVARKGIGWLGKRALYRGKLDSRARCAAHAENLKDYLTSIDPEIWMETEHYAACAMDHARTRLRDVPIDFGGGGNYLLLHFFTRFMKPQTVVETGVALGWSSRAILSAMQKNGCGLLFSSDLSRMRFAQSKFISDIW
jgi:hypothetical protein